MLTNPFEAIVNKKALIRSELVSIDRQLFREKQRWREFKKARINKHTRVVAAT